MIIFNYYRWRLFLFHARKQLNLFLILQILSFISDYRCFTRSSQQKGFFIFSQSFFSPTFLFCFSADNSCFPKSTRIIVLSSQTITVFVFHRKLNFFVFHQATASFLFFRKQQLLIFLPKRQLIFYSSQDNSCFFSLLPVFFFFHQATRVF